MPRPVSRPLALWSAVLLALLAAHDLSHAFDNGLETPLSQLAAVAAPQWLALAVLMAIVLRGDRAHAAASALLLGVGVTIGFAVVHLLPFSTSSYWKLHPSAVSWTLAWSPAALGLALAVLAWSQWRPSTGSSPRSRPPISNVRSPTS